jgi:SAM-dependent methyltransferase
MILRGVTLVGEAGGARDLVVSGHTLAGVEERAAVSTARGPVFDCAGAIAFPGLTNSHDHLEFNLYPALGHRHYADYAEWGADIHHHDAAAIARIERVPRNLRLRWGALKNVLCGVTAVAHHGPARDDLSRLPIGCIRTTSIHSLRGAPRWRWRLNAPVGGSPVVVHIGEGTSRAAAQEIDELLRWNLLRRSLVAVHAIGMLPDQARRFRAVVWCPISNEFLYGTTPDVARWKEDTIVLFGTDSTVSADWNLWSHLRRARALGYLDDRELFDALTRSAATAWRRHGTGALAPGLRANLVVARRMAGDPWDAFFALDPEDILLVLKDGVPVLQDTSFGPASAMPPRSSVLCLGASKKWVAEDVPALLTGLRTFGVEPNLPIGAESVGAPAPAAGRCTSEPARLLSPRSMNGSGAPAGFDAAAARYDDDELGNIALSHMRSRIHEALVAAFARGSRLVELGSGTGTDAAFLSSRHGCRVALVDVAPHLLERAQTKIRAARADGVLGAHQLPAGAVGELGAVYGRASFDGAYSSLGPLNCEPSLEPVADGLASLVRPNGAVLLSIINRWCPTEVAWFALHRQWRQASRRWRGPIQAAAYPGGPKDVTTWYYSRREIARAFSRDFHVEHAEALPLLWPPPYLDFVVARYARTFQSIEPLERWAAKQPLLRDLGDHVLIRLRRR